MTEIPEHLLKRAKERRAAMSGEAAGDEPAAAGGSAVEPAAASAAEAPAAAAAVPEPVAPPPKPVRPEVAAALARRKIPVWALPVLLSMPVWAYVFQGTLEPPPKPADTPIALGEEIYKGCSACHGADGAGGAVGVPLTGVRETWPDYRDHMAWVRIGSAAWPGETYGAQDKPKHPGMPPHPSFSDAELAQVVLYERATFGGLEATDEEYAKLEELSEGEEKFSDVGIGPVAEADGVDPAEATGP